jgi:hypothetical protein
MSSMLAHRISAAVYARLTVEARPATVLARASDALHLDAGGFVVTLADARAPLLPTSVSVAGAAAWADPGERVWLSEREIRGEGFVVRWDPADPPLWDPRVPAVSTATREVVASLAIEIAGGPDPWTAAAALFDGDGGDAVRALAALAEAVHSRDPATAATAAALLLGRGTGLTPVGDDVLAGAAVALAAFAEPLGFAPAERRAWSTALLPPRAADRTTVVSAGLLRLAIRGMAAEPLQRLLQPGATAAERASALERLHRIGHTTGRAYGLGAALCMAELGRAPARDHTRQERIR